MRRRAGLLFLTTLTAEAALFVAPASAGLPSRIDVRAHSIALYSGGDPLLQADGDVVARVGPRNVHAATLRYDLRKNRLIATGDVVVGATAGADDAVRLHVAAYVLDCATGDATALDLTGGSPRTVSVSGRDGHVAVVRGDAQAFDVADLAGQRPFLRGPHAVIVPNGSVRFTPARVRTDVGTVVPAPSYVYAFATNAAFAQQSLPATSFDQPYALFATANALASLHFTYASQTGIAVGLDAHLASGSRSYLVASTLPTVAGGRLDLVGFQQLTPTLSQQVIASRQAGFASAQYQLLQNSRDAVTSLTLAQTQGFETADVRVTSLSRPFGRALSYRLAADVGYDHENGLLPYTSDARTSLEGLLTTRPLTLGGGATLSSSLDVVRTVYNFPRETGSAALTGFVSKPLTPALRLFGIVQFAQNFDRYRDFQSFFYPPQVLTLPDGTVYTGYAAYNGASTLRTYALTATYAPNADVNLQVTLTHHRDFPQFDGFGNPPLSLGFDARFRPWHGPSLEIGRVYIFNWGGRAFAPTYIFSIAP